MLGNTQACRLKLFRNVQFSEYVQKLLDLQEQAKSAKRGRWSEQTVTAVRTVKWVIEDPRALVDHYKHKPIDAVVEQVLATAVCYNHNWLFRSATAAPSVRSCYPPSNT